MNDELIITLFVVTWGWITAAQLVFWKNFCPNKRCCQIDYKHINSKED